MCGNNWTMKKKKIKKTTVANILKEILQWSIITLLIILVWNKYHPRNEKNVEIVTGYISDISAASYESGAQYHLYFKLSGRYCDFLIYKKGYDRRDIIDALLVQLREIEKSHTPVTVWIADYFDFQHPLTSGFDEHVVSLETEGISFPVVDTNRERAFASIVIYLVIAAFVGGKLYIYHLEYILRGDAVRKRKEKKKHNQRTVNVKTQPSQQNEKINKNKSP